MQGGRPPETVDKTLSMVFRCKADGAALQRRRHHVPVREAHGRNMIAEASCRLAFRLSKDPLGEVWRAEALQMESEPGDMRGGFGSLAQQGFPARFPGRAPGAGETYPGDKGPRSRPLSTNRGPALAPALFSLRESFLFICPGIRRAGAAPPRRRHGCRPLPSAR